MDSQFASLKFSEKLSELGCKSESGQFWIKKEEPDIVPEWRAKEILDVYGSSYSDFEIYHEAFHPWDIVGNTVIAEENAEIIWGDKLVDVYQNTDLMMYLRFRFFQTAVMTANGLEIIPNENYFKFGQYNIHDCPPVFEEMDDVIRVTSYKIRDLYKSIPVSTHGKVKLYIDGPTEFLWEVKRKEALSQPDFWSFVKEGVGFKD